MRTLSKDLVYKYIGIPQKYTPSSPRLLLSKCPCQRSSRLNSNNNKTPSPQHSQLSSTRHRLPTTIVKMHNSTCPKCGATFSGDTKTCGSCGAVSPYFSLLLWPACLLGPPYSPSLIPNFTPSPRYIFPSISISLSISLPSYHSNLSSGLGNGRFACLSGSSSTISPLVLRLALSLSTFLLELSFSITPCFAFRPLLPSYTRIFTHTIVASTSTLLPALEFQHEAPPHSPASKSYYGLTRTTTYTHTQLESPAPACPSSSHLDIHPY